MKKITLYFAFAFCIVVLLEQKAESSVAANVLNEMQGQIIALSIPWRIRSLNFARYFAFLMAAIGFSLSIKDILLSGK